MKSLVLLILCNLKNKILLFTLLINLITLLIKYIFNFFNIIILVKTIIAYKFE